MVNSTTEQGCVMSIFTKHGMSGISKGELEADSRAAGSHRVAKVIQSLISMKSGANPSITS
jgi:hypothetical protein